MMGSTIFAALCAMEKRMQPERPPVIQCPTCSKKAILYTDTREHTLSDPPLWWQYYWCRACGKFDSQRVIAHANGPKPLEENELRAAWNAANGYGQRGTATTKAEIAEREKATFIDVRHVSAAEVQAKIDEAVNGGWSDQTMRLTQADTEGYVGEKHAEGAD